MNNQRRPTILVVEDDPAVRQTVADILEFNDYHGIVAEDGLSGLTRARQALPAVIVTDLEMPGMSGYELLRAVRKDEVLRTVPVIVVTAKADRLASRQAMDLGADDYITKPFSEEELIHSIRTRLEKKELVDELDAFAHTVAHDLRDPLASLSGRLGLLELQLAKGDAEACRRSLAQASTSAARLNAIIDEVLLLTGVRRQHVVPEPVDMAAVVAEALAALESALVKSGAHVASPSAWPTAMGYGPWVRHVWSNYLSNAASYAGPAPQIRLGASVDQSRRVARFWVQDNGPGIEPAMAAKLFTPIAGIPTLRAKGQGLGLSIVRRIMSKLGGDAGVESTPGQGALFWFELALATS